MLPQIKRIVQLAAEDASIETDAGRGRGYINRFRKGVVEIELDAITGLLVQAGLQPVIAGGSDGTPPE